MKARSAPQKAEPGDFLVAVDAGHGGIDTGAVGDDTKTEKRNDARLRQGLDRPAEQAAGSQGVPDGADC